MELQSPRKSRERILGFGGPKSGKTEALLSCIPYMPNSLFHFIDTEQKLDYTLENNFPELEDSPQIKAYDLDGGDFQSLRETVLKLRGQVDKDDWVCIDSITPSWPAVQDYWLEKLLGKDMDAFLVDKAYKDLPNGYWQKVSADYSKLINAINELPCHVYVTAQAKELDQPKPGRDAPLPSDLFQVFYPLGVYPAGYKGLSYAFHEVILFRKGRTTEHYMTSAFSASEKTRKYFKDQEFTNWAKEYLMTVAKWKPVNADSDKSN